MAKRYRRLRGDTAYYPFAARTGLRARQRRQVRWLRLLGVTALLVAAALTVRQTVFRGGQPQAPAPAGVPAIQADTAESALVKVEAIAATRDALARTQEADAAARLTPETASTPVPRQSNEILPQYRALYEENPDLVGWLRIDGTEIDLPVVRRPVTTNTIFVGVSTACMPPAGRCFWTSNVQFCPTIPPPIGWFTATTWPTDPCSAP